MHTQHYVMQNAQNMIIVLPVLAPHLLCHVAVVVPSHSQSLWMNARILHCRRLFSAELSPEYDYSSAKASTAAIIS